MSALNLCLVGTTESTEGASCLIRDLQRIGGIARRSVLKLNVLLASDSKLALSAPKLIKQMGYSVEIKALEECCKSANILIAYKERGDDSLHEEDTLSIVYDNLAKDAQLVVRDLCKVHRKQAGVKKPEGSLYPEFERGVNRLQQRIRPISTKGPQVVRIIELRPAPWTTI